MKFLHLILALLGHRTLASNNPAPDGTSAWAG